MNILVCYASKHDATREIADAIAQGIRRRSRENVGVSDEAAAHVAVARADQGPDPVDFDAVVVGSAVYMGRWQRDARGWVDAHANRLADVPLWLFSSGPIGEPPYPVEAPGDVGEISALLDVRGVALFAGRLHRSALHLAERAVVAALRVPDGDYRDWNRIRSWAEAIADDLTPRAAAATRQAPSTRSPLPSASPLPSKEHTA